MAYCQYNPNLYNNLKILGDDNISSKLTVFNLEDTPYLNSVW